jgi:tetratricopeptide (TPR) repeat protein
MLLERIKDNLSADRAAMIVPALMRNNLIWSALLEDAFWFELSAPDQLKKIRWDPVGLAAICLKILPARTEDMNGLEAGLDPELRKSALAQMQTTLRFGLGPQNLFEAALLALAILERFRIIGSWDGLITELTRATAVTGQLLSIWQLPLAIVWGFTNYSADLLTHLSMAGQPKHAPWVVHILLSYPMEFDRRLGLFFDFLPSSSLEFQIQVLKNLIAQGEKDLSLRLAQKLLKSKNATASLAGNIDVNSSSAQISAKIVDLQHSATLAQLAGNPLQALALLEQSLALLEHWRGRTLLSAGNAASHGGQNDQAAALINQLLSLQQQSGEIHGAAILSIDDISGEKILDQLIVEPWSPEATLQRARLIHQRGEYALSQEIGRTAFENWQCIGSAPTPSSATTDWTPDNFLKALMDIGLHDEALNYASSVLSCGVLIPQIFITAGHLAFNQKKYLLAAEFASILSILEPKQIDHHRLLAHSLEKSGDVKRALNIWRMITKQNAALPVDDLALAACAVNAGEYEEALNTAAQYFDNEAVSGLAYGLAGEALDGMGQFDKSIHMLEQGLAIQPDQERTWLALSDLCFKTQNQTRQLEVLRAGSVAVPDSTRIHFALGNTLAAMNRHAEALSCYRRSAHLDPKHPGIFVALIETCRHLGLTTEARVFLQQAEQNCLNDAGLAYQRAVIQIMDGDRHQGLVSLKLALEKEDAPLRWYVEYAEMVFAGDATDVPSDPADSEDALIILEAAGRRFPSEIAIQYWLAKARLISGDIERAKAEFEDLMEVPGAADKEWRWRLLYGLGEILLLQHQVEAAVASLAEAFDINPRHLRLQKIITRAFLEASLSQEAFNMAELVRKSSPMDAQILEWYGYIMEQLGRFDAAADAITLAAQLSPETHSYSIRLSRIYISQGNTELAQRRLAEIFAIPGVAVSDLLQVVELFLALQDAESAYFLLQRIKNESHALPPLALLLETASRFQKQQQIDKALMVVQYAIDTTPDIFGLYVFQADLLVEIRNLTTALASLQQAAQILTKKTDGAPTSHDVLPGWFNGYQVPSGVYYRLGLLLRQVGKLDEALYNLEQAIVEEPERYLYWLAGIELVQALFNDLDHIMVRNVVDHLLSENQWSPNLLEQKFAAAELCAIFAEQYLLQGDIVQADYWIERGRTWQPDSTRLMAANARSLALKGAAFEAEQEFETVSAGVLVTSIAQLPLCCLYQPDAAYRSAYWIGWAAIECGYWDQGIELLTQYAATFSLEPAPLASLIKSLVLTAEQLVYWGELRIKHHAPGSKWNPGKAHALFQRTVTQLEKLTRLPDIDRFKARGILVFEPSVDNAQAFKAMIGSGVDATALAGGWRILGKYNEVAQLARQWNDSPGVLLQTALALSTINPGAALATVLHVLEQPKPNPLAFAVLALVNFKRGDFLLASEALENAISIWPNEPDWHIWAAEQYELLDRLDLAEQHLIAAAQLLPGSLDITLKHARLLGLMGNYWDAAEALEDAAKGDPGCLEIWLQLGNFRQALGDHQNALRCAEKVIDLDENSSAGLELAGNTALILGQSEKAYRYVLRALNINPKSLMLELLLCRVLITSQRRSEALDNLTKINPGDISSPDQAAIFIECLINLRGSSAAKPTLDDFLKLFPDNPILCRLSALSLMEENRLAEAEILVATALKADPSNTDLRLLDGQILRQIGQLDMAIHQLSESIRLMPSLLDAYLELGAVYQQQRQHELAITVYQQAMKIAPGDHRPYYQAGLALRETKDYRGSEILLRRAAQLAPRDLIIRKQLAAIVALNMVTSVQEAQICQ